MADRIPDANADNAVMEWVTQENIAYKSNEKNTHWEPGQTT